MCIRDSSFLSTKFSFFSAFNSADSDEICSFDSITVWRMHATSSRSFFTCSASMTMVYVAWGEGGIAFVRLWGPEWEEWFGEMFRRCVGGVQAFGLVLT